ncbi:MAG: hypothetical protein WA962_08985 [Ornithinimicrobium sp.]
MSSRPIEESWLSLRYRADERAREHSLALVHHLATHLVTAPPAQRTRGRSRSSAAQSGPSISVVDVGAGTGANQRWLGPRLDDALGQVSSQDWHLLDHDAALLRAVEDLTPSWLHSSTRHTGSVATVGELVRTTGSPRLVTCSALLDLLTPSQIEDLVASTVAHADAALWSLSVTGEVAFAPAYPEDALLVDRFNADQQRAESTPTGTHTLAGPVGWQHAVGAFERRGWRVQTAATPWVLGAGDEPLTRRLLTERAGAARLVSEDPDDERVIGRWLDRRLQDAERGRLEIRIDHTDVLALPVKSISEQTSSPS